MRGLVIYLGRLLPDASSGAQQRGRKKINPSLFDLAPNRGLPSQHLSILLVRSYRTFAPLPVLTQALKLRDLSPETLAKPSAVCFCGTLLTVTRTGRYPASLIFREPGLSSSQVALTCNHLANSFLNPV